MSYPCMNYLGCISPPNSKSEKLPLSPNVNFFRVLEKMILNTKRRDYRT
jgi:hypothetical protein